MSAVGKVLFGRWHDPRHPLYVAALFQVATVVLIYADLPYGAVPLVGGTIGALIASVRLQRERRGTPELGAGLVPSEHAAAVSPAP